MKKFPSMCSILLNIFVFTLPILIRVGRGCNLKEAPSASPLHGSYVFLFLFLDKVSLVKLTHTRGRGKTHKSLQYYPIKRV